MSIYNFHKFEATYKKTKKEELTKDLEEIN